MSSPVKSAEQRVSYPPFARAHSAPILAHNEQVWPPGPGDGHRAASRNQGGKSRWGIRAAHLLPALLITAVVLFIGLVLPWLIMEAINA